MDTTMRYRKISALLLASALLAVASGCDITTDPRSTVTDATIFNDRASYKAFLAKLYAGLSLTGQVGPSGSGDFGRLDEGFSQYNRQLWQLQQLPTDEAVIGWGDAGLPELNTQLWASSNQFVQMMFSRIYYQATMVGEFLRETAPEKLAARGHTDIADEIALYRAEARFLRALSYWHGIDLYGDIPLVTEDDGIGSTPPTQSTRAEVYAYAVAELNDIRDDLPAVGAGEYGRADQGAVAMLLAKLYMNAEVYTGTAAYADALTEIQAVIGGPYQLSTNYHDLFLADNGQNPEFIFAIPYDGQFTKTWGGTTFLAHASCGGNMNAANYGLDFCWWGLRAKPEFVAKFPAPQDDSPDGRAIFFTDGQNLEIASIGDFFAGWAAPKFQNVTSAGDPGSNFTHPDTDFPMFRLGDAYLMYAEAVLRGGGGNTGTAVNYVNALRERAYGDDSGNIAAGDLTLDFVLDERSRELWWEGHRRTDLVRYGRFTTSGVWSWKGGTQAGGTTDGFRDLYPIPANEIVSNPNLVQNPGY
jgi:starch-binding outer membrane protein, SusD/RagB family